VLRQAQGKGAKLPHKPFAQIRVLIVVPVEGLGKLGLGSGRQLNPHCDSGPSILHKPQKRPDPV
jgi:hypothetical protein